MKLLGRLCDLAFPPTDRGGMADLGLALAAAVSDEAATAAVDEWIRYEKNCPKPSEMRKLIWEQNEKAAPAPAPSHAAQLPSGPQCPGCKGFGISETIPSGELESIASWCGCQVGYRARLNSCNCPENPEGRCSRSLLREFCCVPPWAVNAARRKLLALHGMNTPARKMPPAAGPAQDDGYRGDF